MKYFLFKSRVFSVALGLAILAISGCSLNSVDFSMTDSEFKPRGKSIAVISGTKEPQNVTLAKMVGDSLRKKSRYQVASVAQISQAINPYPQTIKGPYKSAYLYIDTDWDLGDREKISNMHRALGVDYLYVIWAPISVSNGGSISSVPAVAQLFEKPNAKEVAQTTIDLLVGDDGNEYLKESVEELTRQLAEQTKMAKVTKK
jgi:hypothetical protein